LEKKKNAYLEFASSIGGLGGIQQISILGSLWLVESRFLLLHEGASGHVEEVFLDVLLMASLRVREVFFLGCSASLTSTVVKVVCLGLFFEGDWCSLSHLLLSSFP
jgi:hypothetical protein